MESNQFNSHPACGLLSFAKENIMYRSYREDWNSIEKYQFDSFQGDNE